MTNKIAKKILKMEKDKLMAKPESDRDWELITALDIAICNLNLDIAIRNLKPHGKWILHKDYDESCKYGCNQCGNLNNIPSDVCPNCKAKMDGGEEE